jgi:hypothetical protein
MPTKLEIKANKKEARDLRRTLTAANRKNIKECARYRKMIRAYTIAITKLETDHSNYVANVNRRLAILEGRNEA